MVIVVLCGERLQIKAFELASYIFGVICTMVVTFAFVLFIVVNGSVAVDMDANPKRMTFVVPIGPPVDGEIWFASAVHEKRI